MKRFLTALLLLSALTVSLPSCVVALWNSGGTASTGCSECEHCEGDGDGDSFEFEEIGEEHEKEHEGEDED